MSWHARGGRPKGGGFGHGAHGDRFHGRQRTLAAGDLRLALLGLIASEPRHGYDLIRLVEQQTGGAYAPSPGVVYPALSLLEDIGQIALTSQSGGRKEYRITPAGEAELAAKKAELAAINGHLASLANRGREENTPVRRAMDNLKMALGTALTAPKEGAAFAIAAIIDEAAQKIERLG